MPIALWAYPTYALSTASAFSLADLIAQHLELRYTSQKDRPQTKYLETSDDDQTNEAGGISGTRILFFGSLGIVAGLAITPVVHMVSNILPTRSALTVIGKTALVEICYMPALVAGLLGASAFFHQQRDWEAVWRKIKADFFPTILPHIILAPAWSLLFLNAVPVPGFKFGLPGAVVVTAVNIPYLVFASYRASQSELPLDFNMLPFTWGDVLCKPTALCFAICMGCAYINCVSQVLTDYVGTTGVLWDPGFKLLPFVDSVWIIDMFVTASLALGLGHMLTKSHPPFPVLLRRLLLLHSMTLLLRSVTLVAAAPFFPNPELTCVEEHPWPLPISALMVLLGTGHTCHDLMFSGHAGCIMLPTLYIQRYSKSTAFKTVAWSLAGCGLTAIVATHAHYSIDVAVAVGVSSTLWHYYHRLLARQPAKADADSTWDTLLSTCAQTIRSLEDDKRLLGTQPPCEDDEGEDTTEQAAEHKEGGCAQ